MLQAGPLDQAPASLPRHTAALAKSETSRRARLYLRDPVLSVSHTTDTREVVRAFASLSATLEHLERRSLEVEAEEALPCNRRHCRQQAEPLRERFPRAPPLLGLDKSTT